MPVVRSASDLTLIGVLSRKDLKDRPGETVADVMSREPVACPVTAKVADAAGLMLLQKVRQGDGGRGGEGEWGSGTLQGRAGAREGAQGGEGGVDEAWARRSRVRVCRTCAVGVRVPRLRRGWALMTHTHPPARHPTDSSHPHRQQPQGMHWIGLPH